MHKPKWYVIDRLQSAVLCRDRQEAEDIVAENMARWPSTGPWRAALMVEIDIPKPPEVVVLGGHISASSVDGVPQDALAKAHRQARLHGPLESALSSPALATCLRNIVHAHQADPARSYDLATDGKTIYILPPALRTHIHSGVDPAAGPDGSVTTTFPHQRVDRKRLAAGDDC